MSPEYEDTPFGHALLSLYCDCRFQETKDEVSAKFELSDTQANEIVRAAQDSILMGLEARNPEAWRELGLRARL